MEIYFLISYFPQNQGMYIYSINNKKEKKH